MYTRWASCSMNHWPGILPSMAPIRSRSATSRYMKSRSRSTKRTSAFQPRYRPSLCTASRKIPRTGTRAPSSSPTHWSHSSPRRLTRMNITHDVHTVHTKHPFVIARGGASEWKLVRVRIVDRDGVEGWGEAAPNRFYGETTDSAIAALEKLGPVAERVLSHDAFALED